MKFTTLLAAVPAFQISQVVGHSVFTTLFVNDVNQGDGACVRMPTTPSNATFPINDLSSTDMACGYDGTKGVPLVCPITQSSKLSFLFREYPDGSQPGAIDVSHKGPCAVYMKSVSSPLTDPGTGDGWFKVYEDGYDESTSQWCTEKLMANNGFLSVDIPSDLKGGYYLVRPELLALHQADKTPPNPQFYTGCAQVFLNSTGTGVPSNTVSIPGYTNISDPSVLFNIYTPVFPYTPPGPSVYISSSTSSKNSPISQAISPPIQNEGLLPPNIIVQNANWYATELASYSTETGCWNASQVCFDETKTCYDTAPPTGDEGCRAWEARCTSIQTACGEGNFEGPPEEGKVLTPSLATYSIPAAAAVETGSGGGSGSITSTSGVASTTAGAGAGDGYGYATTLSTLTSTSSPAQTASPSQLSASSTPSSTSDSSSDSSSVDLTISEDGSCGGDKNQTCIGSEFGDCCSIHGWCGSSADYCGVAVCQDGDFGSCGLEERTVGRERERGGGRFRW